MVIIMKVQIQLDSVEKVKEFNQLANRVSFPMDVISGKKRYLDAKSLLGLLSCDLTKPMLLDLHPYNQKEEEKEFISKIEGFIKSDKTPV